MTIKIYNQQKDLRLSSSEAKKILATLLQSFKIKTDELSVYFVTKKKITEVHGNFFSDATPTDCMSFPIDPPNAPAEHHILGEVFVCPKVAIEYAELKGLDSHQETALYMIHGFLHLIGYDDLDPISRKKMRSMEKKCLALTSGFSLKPNKKRSL